MGNFSLILINTAFPNNSQLSEPLSSQNYYFSLNRNAKKTGSKLYFNAINLNTLKMGEYIYKPLIREKDELVDLGPLGFSVHKIGANIKSFEFTANISDYMDYYLIEFN